MTASEENDLTPEEQRAFAALPREIAPSADLENRVLAAVRRERAAGSPFRKYGWLAAAAVLVFAAGYSLALIARPSAPSPASGRYLLLLYETSHAPIPAAEEATLVAEYSAWAERERRAGTVESGDKLDDDFRLLGPSLSTSIAPQPAGLFVVRAASLDEAEAIGRRCPHLQHGGTVVVRPISR